VAHQAGARAVDEAVEQGVEYGALDTPAQIFMLFAEELPAYLADRKSFTETVRDGERTYLELFDLEPPFVVVGQPPALSEWKRRSDRSHTSAAVGEVI